MRSAQIRRVQNQGVRRFTANTRSTSAGVESRKPMPFVIPALLTTSGIAPKRATSSSPSRSPSTRAMSVTTVSQPSSSASASRPAASRSSATTAAPAPASRWATLRPIPEAAPVTSAVRPSTPGSSTANAPRSAGCGCQSGAVDADCRRGRLTNRTAVETRAPSTRVEVEAAGIHAVALAGGPRAVREHMAEVTTTALADDLLAHHAVRDVALDLDRVGDQRLGEARPAGARVELGRRVEQLGTTTGAAVHAVVVTVPVLPGEGALGARLSQHLVLLGVQLFAPLGIGLRHWIRRHKVLSHPNSLGGRTPDIRSPPTHPRAGPRRRWCSAPGGEPRSRP